MKVIIDELTDEELIQLTERMNIEVTDSYLIERYNEEVRKVKED